MRRKTFAYTRVQYLYDISDYQIRPQFRSTGSKLLCRHGHTGVVFAVGIQRAPRFDVVLWTDARTHPHDPLSPLRVDPVQFARLSSHG